MNHDLQSALGVFVLDCNKNLQPHQSLFG
uniref:Uncharacterized protein n=1 Tax=Anguilla anguilla TaxID=7936 RepID=A0A0E9QI03_ANGAN